MGKPRILLFGRTGSGKSTVSNMLARGHLDPPLLFQTSCGARGQTLSTQTEECEEMVIVDTVGLGESDLGSVSHEEAKNILYNFFLKLEGGFNYFAFVRKWGRNDNLDEQLWGFFRQAFKGAEQNFIVIFTGVGKLQEKELEKPETKQILLKLYDPCQRWIFVNFGRQGKKALNRSLTNLQVKLSEIRGPALAPEVCKHLTLGVILLVGRREKAKRILANLLVNDDNLEKPELSGHLIKDGRRWQVVEVPALWERDYLPDNELMVAPMVQQLILAAQKGFSHVVFVHESGHGHEQDETVDKILWKMVLTVFNGVVRNERLMVVIAGDRQQATSSRRVMAESSMFPGCQNLVHLDLPILQLPQYSSGVSTSSSKAGPHERLHTALRIFEQALQINKVDTQSTLFHLEILPTGSHMNRLVEEVVHIDSSEEETLSLGLVLTEFNSPLSNLSREYRKIVTQSDISVQIQQCLTWKERHAGNAVDPDFCESSQRVIGERCDFRNLTMKCVGGSPVQGINVIIEYKDKSEIDIDSNHEVSEHEGGNVISEAQLVVLAPDSHTEIGERISVYTNHILMDDSQFMRCTIRESSFVKNIQADHKIALFLHSKPGRWCNYTFYASLRLVR